MGSLESACSVSFGFSITSLIGFGAERSSGDPAEDVESPAVEPGPVGVEGGLIDAGGPVGVGGPVEADGPLSFFSDWTCFWGLGATTEVT